MYALQSTMVKGTRMKNKPKFWDEKIIPTWVYVLSVFVAYTVGFVWGVLQ